MLVINYLQSNLKKMAQVRKVAPCAMCNGGVGLSPFLRTVPALPPAPCPQQAVRSAGEWLPAPGRVLHRCSGAGERAGSQFRSARASSKPVPATLEHFAASQPSTGRRRGNLHSCPRLCPDTSPRPNGTARGQGLMGWERWRMWPWHRLSTRCPPAPR